MFTRADMMKLTPAEESKFEALEMEVAEFLKSQREAYSPEKQIHVPLSRIPSFREQAELARRLESEGNWKIKQANWGAREIVLQ